MTKFIVVMTEQDYESCFSKIFTVESENTETAVQDVNICEEQDPENQEKDYSNVTYEAYEIGGLWKDQSFKPC